VTAVSDAARQARQARALVTFVAPPSLGVLRVTRAEHTEHSGQTEPSAEDDGRPATGLLSGAWVHPITLGVTSIGRGLQNDCVLTDPAVSRDHARLIRQPDGWWIENLAERNPLWVGDQTVPSGARVAIRPGDAIELGNTTLQFLAPLAPAHATFPGGEAAPDAAPDLADLSAMRTLPLPALSTHTVSSQARVAQTVSLHATGEITALEAGATNLLSPGVTLQFALSGKFGPRARWILGGVALLIFLVCAVLTLGLAALMGQTAFAAGGLGAVLAAITIPLIPALGVALLVGLLDRYEREPPLLLLGAFLWGAVIAIPPVLYIERALNGVLVAAFGGDAAGALSRSIALATSAGVTEETIKGAGLLLLLFVLRDEFDNVTDGVLYGALIGAGFAMVENFVYFATTPRDDLAILIFGRVVLGWLGHSTFTALFGAGLGYARERHGRRLAWQLPLIGFLAGLLLHTLFDFVAFSAETAGSTGGLSGQAIWLGVLTVLLDYVPLFGAQALLLRMVLVALEREAAIVREHLAPEVPPGVTTPDEYVLLQNASLRVIAERQYLFAYGLRAYLTARSLYQAQTGLAFRKWHVAEGDPPKATARQPEDAYRERIARLRRSLLRQLRRHPLVAGQTNPTGAPRTTRSTRALPRA
jgi:RsiW-degrading membrane proteinase PrsW (M82 family)